MDDLSLRYATALYDIALEENEIDSYQEECKTILSLLKDNEEFLDVLNSSFLSIEEKTDIVNKTLVGFKEDILSLIKIVISNHRVNYLTDIFVSFNSLVNQHKGIVEGLLYSAFPLKEATIRSIEETLSKKEKRKVSLIYKIDPSLIGGIRIVINNRIYDGSIKNKISELKYNLTHKEGSSL